MLFFLLLQRKVFFPFFSSIFTRSINVYGVKIETGILGFTKKPKFPTKNNTNHVKNTSIFSGRPLAPTIYPFSLDFKHLLMNYSNFFQHTKFFLCKTENFKLHWHRNNQWKKKAEKFSRYAGALCTIDCGGLFFSQKENFFIFTHRSTGITAPCLEFLILGICLYYW